MAHTLDVALHDAPAAEQISIFFDAASYSAFPHVIRLEGNELLLAFRQAPAHEIVSHVHPRSIITLIRSYDLGRTWDIESATQVAAGGGQELSLLYLGQGRVVGALAKHLVAPYHEGQRAGTHITFPGHHPFDTEGSFWLWSDTYGLIWRLQDSVLISQAAFACAPPVRLSDGTLVVPTYGQLNRQMVRAASILYRSQNGGLTWSAPIFMAEGSVQTRGYNEPVLVELEPGHLFAMHRIEEEQVNAPHVFWQNESPDGGLTWTEPVPTAIVSGACPRLLKLADGRLLLTYGRRFPPHGIYARLSEDGGRSWGGAAWLLRATPNGDQGYTSSVQLADGRILTATYAQDSAGVTGIVGTYWQLPT